MDIEVKQDRSQLDQQLYSTPKDSIPQIIPKNKQQSLYQGLLNVSQSATSIKPETKQCFHLSNIKYDQESFQQSIQITVLESTKNYEAIKLTVSYGKFTIHLNVINIDQKNPIRNLNQCYEGGFGFVYKYNSSTSPTAIKCTNLNMERFQIGLREAIKEYFFLVIASSLKIGPKLVQLFGFDILVFRDSFVFCMELCEMGSYKINDTLEALKGKLHLLHSFNIVHRDIKPENIGFSPSFKEYIFIDFGLSRMVKEQIGAKTYTNFVGSFNFCSPEMLELYLQEKNGFVNLYYNDAFCLDKSFKKIDSQVLGESQQFPSAAFTDKTIHRLILSLQINLSVKYFLFRFSIRQITSEQAYSYLNNNLNIIVSLHKNRYESFEFIMNLPQSVDLISFCKQNFKKILLFDERSQYTYDQTIQIQKKQENDLLPLFEERFEKLKQINQQKNQNQKMEIDLFDSKSVAKAKFMPYKLALIKFIKINNSVEQFSQKISACSVFNEIYMINKEKPINDAFMYKRTVEHIFESTLESNQAETYKTLLHCIETVVVLQIFSVDRLIEAYSFILRRNFEFVCKMRLIFKFIESMEFIKQKFQTNYNYFTITPYFMADLLKFLNYIDAQIVDTQERDIIDLLRNIIYRKINKRNVELNNDEFIVQQQLSMQPRQLKLLKQSIYLYNYNRRILTTLQKYNRIPLQFFKQILVQLNLLNYFSFINFNLYSMDYQIIQNSLNRSIYQLFLRKFGDFEQHKHFKIYFTNKLNIVKDVYPDDFVHWNNQTYHQKKIQKNQIEYQQIFNILNYIVKTKDYFHLYLKQFLSITCLQQNPIYMKCIIKLILNNHPKITKLSQQYHFTNLNFNQYKLKKQLFVINKILQISSSFLPQKQFSEYSSQVLNNCQQVFSQIECLECKISGLLQMQKIYMTINWCKQRQQQFFLLMLDTITMCLKDQFLRVDGIALLSSNLVRKWVTSKYLFSKYNLRPLLYEIIVEKNYIHYCFVQGNEYYIFTSLYMFISNQDVEVMLNYLVKILDMLLHPKFTHYGVYLYQYLMGLLIYKRLQEDQIQLQYHRILVNYIIDQKLYKQRALFALFLYPFLQIGINMETNIKILKTISLCLNYLHKTSKDLIINHYYYRFATYIKVSQRKKKYLLDLYHRNCYDITHFVLKVQIQRNSDKYGIHKNKIKMLRKFIKKYKQNVKNPN